MTTVEDYLASLRDFEFRGQRVPRALHVPLARWCALGDYDMSAFLRACLRNDLQQATALADEATLPFVAAVAAWLYNEAPSGCQGSHDRLTLWEQKKQKEAEAQ